MTLRLGTPVMIYDDGGTYRARGVVAGIRISGTPAFDIQPDRTFSLSERLLSIPEDRLRPVGKPFLAYERKPDGPRHIDDRA